MKYGIHLSTYTQNWNDIDQYIKISKDLGYDGVEIPLMDPTNFQVNKYQQYLKEYQLDCTCGTCMTHTRDISSENEALRIEGVQHLKRCIDICEQLGSQILGGVLHSPWGLTIPREENKKRMSYSMKSLKEINHYAKEKGVTLTLELVNRYETYWLNTVKEGVDFLKELQCSNIKLHFDTFHANIEEKNIYDSLILGKGFIEHIHFCDNDRGSLGQGHIRWDEVKQGIREIQYDNWITIENFVMPNCQCGNETFTWRNIQESGLEAAEQGILFMKNLFQE